MIKQERCAEEALQPCLHYPTPNVQDVSLFTTVNLSLQLMMEQFILAGIRKRLSEILQSGSNAWQLTLRANTWPLDRTTTTSTFMTLKETTERLLDALDIILLSQHSIGVVIAPISEPTLVTTNFFSGPCLTVSKINPAEQTLEVLNGPLKTPCLAGT